MSLLANNKVLRSYVLFLVLLERFHFFFCFFAFRLFKQKRETFLFPVMGSKRQIARGAFLKKQIEWKVSPDGETFPRLYVYAKLQFQFARKNISYAIKTCFSFDKKLFRKIFRIDFSNGFGCVRAPVCMSCKSMCVIF